MRASKPCSAAGSPNVRGRVSRLENGPPVGYPIKLRVSGPDPAKLPAIVGKVQDALRKDPAIRDVNSDLGERLQTVRLIVDQDKARALGVSSKQIADTTQNSLSGHATTQYREGDRLIDVVTRLEGAERTDLSNIKDTKLYTRDGKYVALSQVARIELGSETSILLAPQPHPDRHRARRRRRRRSARCHRAHVAAR